MNKGRWIITALFILSSCLYADAVFVPPDGDIFDLDHYYAYTWGIDLGASTAVAPITEAHLVFDNIQNWWYEDLDVMYVNLIDDAQIGLRPYRDNQAAGNYFEGVGINIIQWSDLSDRDPSDESFRFSLIPGAIEALNQYGLDGTIAFGIDPDCHYWNDGVRFEIITAAVPAPGAIMLGTVGLVFVGWLRTRKAL